MQLQLIRKGTNRVAIEVFTDEGALVYTRMVSRYQPKDVEWLTQLTYWSIAETNENLREFCERDSEDEEETTDVYQIDPPSELVNQWLGIKPPSQSATEDSLTFVCHIRELNQPKSTGLAISDDIPSNAFRKAILADVKWIEPLIEWTDINRLCCLDIDYHYTAPPDRDTVEDTVTRIRPVPFCWHFTHGGGCKLYFESRPGYTAVELASVAALQWITLDPTATFDLIKSTRHPCFPRTRDNAPAPCPNLKDIYYQEGSGDVGSIRRLMLGEVSREDIEEWLSDKGWRFGQMLPHTECPIDAGNSSDEAKASVYVGDDGIFCHRCYQRGMGGSRPGFRSFSSLMGSSGGPIRTMVRNFTHVEHARVVLQNHYPSVAPKVLENIYQVLLKISHATDDPRINMAMRAGKGFIRIRGKWASADGEISLAEALPQYVRSLPAALVPCEDGFTVNTPAYIALCNAGDVEEYGYPDISFIRGCKIFGVHNQYPHNEYVKVVARKEFRDVLPRYLPPSKRMPMAESWNMLDQEYPGVNRTYVKLLICAKGSAEGRLSQCPFLMITGVSSAGKSTTAHIAAGICGDKADEPIFYPDVQRFRASLMDAAKNSGFVCINEVFKMANRAKISYTQALDPMLSLTEDSRSHELYVGSVPFGRLPVFILTDITCPHEVVSDYQLARRFTFFNLASSIDWEPSLVARGIRPHQFRMISAEHCLAADSILSEVIDEFFQEPMQLVEMAKRLGIATTRSASTKFVPTSTDGLSPLINSTSNTGTNENDDEDEEQDSEMISRTILKNSLSRLYHEICQAPPLGGSHKDRYSGKGWKLIDRMVTSPMLELWMELSDKGNWQESRICSAEDWGKLLQTSFPVVLEIARYTDRYLYVRFRDEENPRKPRWVNGQVIDYPSRPGRKSGEPHPSQRQRNDSNE